MKKSLSLILPAFLTLFSITVFPLTFSIFTSFHRLDLKTVEGFRFVGLYNYLYGIKDPTFQKSMLVTLEYMSGTVAVELILGLLLALILNLDLRIVKVLRGITIIPLAISPMGVALIFKLETQQEIGIIAYILKEFFHVMFQPLINTYQALGMLILVDAWQWTPFVALVLLAGLRSIPVQVMEAAKMDCKSSLQMLRNIVLPLLKYPLIVVALIRIMDAFSVFEYVYMLTGGAPGDSTLVVTFWIYKVGMRYLELGKACALSYIVFGVVLIIIILYIKYALKER
ncbi:MAG: sugar ABC transporter permease [Candidatus Bathyarchaeia archaeon]